MESEVEDEEGETGTKWEESRSELSEELNVESEVDDEEGETGRNWEEKLGRTGKACPLSLCMLFIC